MKSERDSSFVWNFLSHNYSNYDGLVRVKSVPISSRIVSKLIFLLGSNFGHILASLNSRYMYTMAQ